MGGKEAEVDKTEEELEEDEEEAAASIPLIISEQALARRIASLQGLPWIKCAKRGIPSGGKELVE